MNQALQLYQLQLIDTQISKVINRLKEINIILETDQTVFEAEQYFIVSKIRFEKSRHSLTKLEDLVQTQQIKIETCNSSLYSGRIQNPKELRDLQNELNSLKRYLTTLEDQQLEALVVYEQLEQEMTQADGKLDQAKARYIEMRASIFGEKSQLEKLQATLEDQRNVVLNAITPENLGLYNKIVKIKRGLAVAQINDGTCMGCGANIRPAELQAARSPNQIVFCSSCGRILYAG
jgi:predicted  nucleic acid-binding Zn-ribbon protein